MTDPTIRERLPRDWVAEVPVLSDRELVAIRAWHQKQPRRPVCKQGDPWPCRTARLLATLDAVRFDASAPKQIAKFYAEWNARLEADRG